MRVDEATWAAIRRAYTETTEPVYRMAVRFQVGRTTIHQRALAEGWPPRPSCAVHVTPAPLPQVATEQVSPAPVDGDVAAALSLPSREPETPEARVARLLRIIDLQLERMESRMRSSKPMSAQDEERHVRAVDTTVEVLEKVGEIATDATKPRRRGRKPDAAAADTERMRREIAERLERLNAQWLAQSKPR